jgi:hypothetical protein
MPEINKNDLLVEHIRRPDAHPLEADLGVRITHTPSGMMVEAVSEPTRLANTAEALDDLRRLLDERESGSTSVEPEVMEPTTIQDVEEVLTPIRVERPRPGQYSSLTFDGRVPADLQEFLAGLNEGNAEFPSFTIRIVAVIPHPSGRVTIITEEWDDGEATT